MKIYVHIEDGMVSDVLSDTPIEIIVVDHDMDPEDAIEGETWVAWADVSVYTVASHPLE